MGLSGLAFFNGLGMSSQWQTFRLALASVPFPLQRPAVRPRTSGFFVFELPAYNALSNWLTGVLILTTVLTLAVHVIDGAIQPWAKLQGLRAAREGAPLGAHGVHRARVGLPLLDLRSGSSTSRTRGQIVGAGYTDVHAQLPAYRILIVVSIVTAGALLLNIRYKGWRLPLIALGVWVAASILLGAVWPGLMQQFIVAPNEASAETPYIERNIEMTRKAFGLDRREGPEVPGDREPDRRRHRRRPADAQERSAVGPGHHGAVLLRSCSRFGRTTSSPTSTSTATPSTACRQQVLVSAREMNSELLPRPRRPGSTGTSSTPTASVS